MLDFWQQVPWWIKVPLSVVVILLGVVIAASAAMAGTADDPLVNRGRRNALVLGGLLIVGGVIMFAMSFPSGPEKRGYNF